MISLSLAVDRACARRASRLVSANAWRSPRSTDRRHLCHSRLRAEEAFRLRFAIFRTFRGRGRLWLDCAPAKFDWSTLIANKDKEIARLEAIYQNGVQKAGGTTFASRATLVDAHTIRLEAEDRTVTADQILIATGGRPPGILRCRATNTASRPMKPSISKGCQQRS
jgi:hypothetical protein